MTPDMITCSCFTAREDRATLRSDPSARASLREAVCMSMLPFLSLPPGNQSAKPRGPGQSPGSYVFSRCPVSADIRQSDGNSNTPAGRAFPDPTGSDLCCSSPSNRRQQLEPAHRCHTRQSEQQSHPSCDRRSSPAAHYPSSFPSGT